MQYLIKLFPEITIKSRPVRSRMVAQLQHNLLALLRPIDPQVRIQREWDRLVMHSDTTAPEATRIVEILRHTPGISNFLQVVESDWQGMEDAFEKTRALWGERLKGKTFALRCKRSGQHSFKSQDVEYQVGGLLKTHCDTAGVCLNEPQVLIRLELRQDRLAIVLDRHEGLGGYPLGTQDGVLSLVSGGFDSTVASYLTMKRGLLTHFCFFNLGGRAHEIGVKEVAAYLWMKYGASHPVRFVSVPFEGVVSEILQKVDNSQMGVVLKRMMLRAATQVADELGIVALVTGESVAQVSSQTLQNLSVIDQVTDTLVLRPLITMDKTDIIRLARQIGTESFAETMPEYCGVISVKPTTRAKMERIEKEESYFDFAILEQALRDKRIQRIDQMVNESQNNDKATEVAHPSTGDQIIDIRHPDEQERKPLHAAHGESMQIPFYQLHSRFADLDHQTRWLLYCDKGIMSQLHAQYLRDEGFSNVAVYRPTTE